MKVSVLLGVGALTTGGLSQGVFPERQPHQPTGNGTKLLNFDETVLNSTLRAQSITVDWLSGGEDGQYVYMSDDGALKLENFVTGESSVFVPANEVPKDYREYWIRSDLEKVLWATNATKQYRHSYFADYFVFDVNSGNLTALVEDQAGDIQYATLAPTGDAIAFVRGNNLFISNNSDITQITFDGGPDMFHGVPDWVYEEEIFGDRFTLWFSPDAQFIAYLSFNETGVPTYRIPYYMNDTAVAPPYPRELELRYPKVGATNPTVSFTLLDLAAMDNVTVPITAFSSNDTVVGEVAWVTEGHSSVVYRVFNRVQDLEKVVLVDTLNMTSLTIRERDGTDGWIDNGLSINYVGRVNESSYSGQSTTYYVDLSDISGWNHIYLFPVGKGDPIALTRGEWEVVSILKIDTERQLVYFTSTEHHSTDRHVYSVSYATTKKTALVDDTKAGSWSASFSSDGAYYLLSYAGPDVPYQELYSVNSTIKPLRTVTNNTALYTKLQEYALPDITYFELEHPDGFTLNVMERLPPSFNASKQYPVLFTPYGGPGAQQVSKSMAAFNWNAYIASDPELEFITYTIDGRGTGYKGRSFRAAVTKQLGKLETQDQIWAAQELIRTKSYIDPEKLGMWGWSFGGYLTSKVVEADSGVFTFGLITAPVSDWRFYDSMYTERYMKTYSANEAGYNETAVRNATGFKNIAGGFAIMHGTGDDNVHYQNSAALVDLLVGEGVKPGQMKMMAFTDSDHGINYHGATAYIYRFLTERLWDEKQRVSGGSGLVHQWGRRTIE